MNTKNPNSTKVKLKEGVKLSSMNNYCELDYDSWVALNQGKEVELDVVPENIKEKLDIKLVSTIDEALELALVKKPDAIDWDEDTWLAEQKKLTDNQSNLTAH